MEKNFSNENLEHIDTLTNVGLSSKESTVYEILLKNGQVGIGPLLKLLPYKRGDLYNILYSLRDKGIIEQTIKGSKIEFRPCNPYKLLEFVDKQKQFYLESYSQVQDIIPSLFHYFNLLYNQPSIYTKNGLEGLKDVHELIYKSKKKEILLFRSVYDIKNDEYAQILRAHRAKRIELGINVRALTPANEKARENYFTKDKEHLFERRLINPNKFTLPAQIDIWGNNVAIVSLRDSIVTTVIENKDIAQTFRLVFNLIWDMSKQDHDSYIKKWTREDSKK
ncbi:MAG: helix-turn-helix domain-containing protein [bacterium]